jgi:apolipoprotein D and lipocalin family protein
LNLFVKWKQRMTTSDSTHLRPSAASSSLAIRGLLVGMAMASGLGFIGSAHAELAPLQAVPSLDVQRYMGTWHEIAKYPNWFQNKCASSTQATYSALPNGQLQVLNRCKTDRGEWREALGAARQIGGPTSAQLKVRFAPEWLSFIPMVWGNYWIIALDTDYQWVLVSEPQREYLWILSRTPNMPASTYQALLGKLEGLGFDLKRLETTPP